MSVFQNKVAVVTGAGSGIGRALAIALAKDGARLALSDINEVSLAETIHLLRPGAEARGYRVDVTSREAVFAHAGDVKRDFGTAHLLFNNAGGGIVGTFDNHTIEEMEWLLDLDVWSVIYCTKAFLPTLLAQRDGWIVNISSIAGLIGIPGLNSYNIAKFAVRGLTEGLWTELEGTGVSALCVHPGGIKTGIARASPKCRAAGAIEARADEWIVRTLTTPPERCAADILDGIRRGKRRVVTGRHSSTIDWMARLLPGRYPALIGRILGS